MKSKEPEYRAAYWKSWAAKNRPKRVRVCTECSKEFTGVGAQLRCDDCRKLTCKLCGSTFIPANASLSSVYCSRRCKDAALAGAEPPWLAANRGKKPRVYHLTHRDKHGSAADREWRSAVFVRDDYTCQSCGARGGRLHAHHLKPYKEYPELRHVLSNGVTLCIPCHRKTESYGWSSYWKKIAAKRLSQEVLPLVDAPKADPAHQTTMFPAECGAKGE